MPSSGVEEPPPVPTALKTPGGALIGNRALAVVVILFGVLILASAILLQLPSSLDVPI
ncbi:MAG: hypothetical protein V3U52_08205 [Thermoplasmata archaeon]